MAFLVEMVVHRCVDGDEFLQGSHPPEAKDSPLSSSKWLVEILCPVVLPAAGFLSLGIANDLHRRAVGT
jgi:hypothetical protein